MSVELEDSDATVAETEGAVSCGSDTEEAGAKNSPSILTTQ